MPYEYFDHQADLGIRGLGETPESALSQGALALLAAIADLGTIGKSRRFVQRCSAPDIPSLFVEWLNELLYQREVHDVLFACARVTRLVEDERGWHLEGVAQGETIDLDRHQVHTEIKAATYAGLAYRREGDSYLVQCIVDV
jgi:tRNA nucleotidyltransferase (CCA-adding enzyme)